ncbi:MAG: chemotaxis protein CheB, partial [Anaeromyxobacteraceae bacterium]
MSDERAVRVLLAARSAQLCETLVGVLAGDEAFVVIASVSDALAAAAAARALQPDVIAIDLDLADAGGIPAIAQVMADAPAPILVLADRRDDGALRRALALGALDLLETPLADADPGAFGDLLRSRLRLLAGVRVRRTGRAARRAGNALAQRSGRCELVLVGASLGGPRALAALLRALPPDFPAPIAIVQHIVDGFTGELAAWLAQACGRDVRIAHDGDALVPGSALLAPSGRHLVVDAGVARLSDAPPVGEFRPSVTSLFASAARVYGARACG